MSGGDRQAPDRKKGLSIERAVPFTQEEADDDDRIDRVEDRLSVTEARQARAEARLEETLEGVRAIRDEIAESIRKLLDYGGRR